MKIALITGGESNERNVALAGAYFVRKALRDRGHLVTLVDAARGPVNQEFEDSWLSPNAAASPYEAMKVSVEGSVPRITKALQSNQVLTADCAFILLHGGSGENGVVQAILTDLNVPFTGADHLACAISFDKVVSKSIFQAVGVPTPRWVTWPATKEQLAEIGLPCVVKPSQGGSTLGLSVVNCWDDLAPAIALASKSTGTILIEEFVSGREFTVGVLDNQVLAVGEIIPKSKIFDYTCKYKPDMAAKIFPADISDVVKDEISHHAITAHRALGLDVLSRIDFMMSAEGGVFCLEANAIPGMTATSLFPRSASAVGISFESLCEELCFLALRNRRKSICD